jgi:geranylgeranyl pyrophosphate synthase
MLEKLTSYQERINLVLAELIAQRREAMPEQLFDALNYASIDAGKRLRPALVYAVGEALEVPLALLDAPAAAVELIHTYSLVHDDLPAMDDDDLRRGKPTTHIAFDEATAILVGDALQALAFEVLAEAPYLTATQRVEMVRVLAQSAGANGMVAGQMRDLLAENSHDIPLAELRELHQQKTGALITAAVTLGGLASAQATADILLALSVYSAHLGLAFQIQDDVLDVTQDSATLGKPQGSDQRQNKTTFVSLLGLEKAQQEAVRHADLARDALSRSPLHANLLGELCAYIVTRTY